MPNRRHNNPNSAPTADVKRSRRGKRGWLTGTLVELDAETRQLTIRVREARGINLDCDEEITIDVAAASLNTADGDGDGRPGITDLFPGDQLDITLAPQSHGTPPAAVSVTQSSPAGPVGGLRRLWSRRDS